MSRYRHEYGIAVMAVLFWSGSATGITELAGVLPQEITAEKSPYLVKADIFVETGKTVRIEPGTVFLFSNFTGLHVQGVLTVKGTPAHPVVFSSAHDRAYATDTLNPTPYDWNGIYIQKDGMGTVMENFVVRHSVKGIVSETKFINLSGGLFAENGRSHCTIEGVEQTVTAGKPFSFTVSLKDATVDGVPVNILRDPQALKRNVVRYSGLTILLGGMTLGAIFGREYRDSQAALDALSSPDTSNTFHHVGADWIAVRDKRDFDRTATVVGALLTLAGGAGFCWTFTF